ncbi:hypothetical protein CW362_38770 [Streptomyces populi]|uniref:Uncharacterized protein n=1 Tax=Streptomyces populi TaxID=2058924 RepID=A0A2I0SCV0_9ACTN|nr:hypothetical protein [Streptomyces populi]PKT67750.1 hypothetical protein CW362_38770 [Streptomyces populi]
MLSDAEYAYLRSELGDIVRGDLDVRYQRLGTVEAVAVEVLRERKAALIADPLTVTVQEVATVNNTENVRALERQLALLEQAEASTLAPQQPTLLVRRRIR